MKESLYKKHKIKICSYKLKDGGWVPSAAVFLHTQGQVLEKTVNGDAHKPLTTLDEADAAALQIAKKWIDDNS